MTIYEAKLEVGRSNHPGKLNFPFGTFEFLREMDPADIAAPKEAIFYLLLAAFLGNFTPWLPLRRSSWPFSLQEAEGNRIERITISSDC